VLPGGALASTLMAAHQAARSLMSASLSGAAITFITAWLRPPLR
jgi:hypothetical protein